MPTAHAYAATAPGAPLEPFEYDLPDLGPDEIDIKVTHCGICHSDLSMRNNDWGFTEYPFVPGHEAAGTVEAVGDHVTHLKPGDRVGLGWHAGACMRCRHCMDGDHNLCADQVGTIVGRHGGFADRVRTHAAFAVALPEGVEVADAGPLFCGGITVFDPIRRFARPTDRIGVIGIGGLGHMALQFARAWGCHVTAFTSSESKADEARSMGAHDVVSSRDDKALEDAAGSFDMIISTVNVSLNWEGYINALAPDGRLHVAGAGEVLVEAFAHGIPVGPRPHPDHVEILFGAVVIGSQGPGRVVVDVPVVGPAAPALDGPIEVRRALALFIGAGEELHGQHLAHAVLADLCQRASCEQ